MRSVLAVLITITVLALTMQPSSATFPGETARSPTTTSGRTRIRSMRIEPDGSGEVQLTSGRRYSDNPAWSPDGSEIAFVRQGVLARSPSLFVMDADGSGQTRVLRGRVGKGRLEIASAAWSPDGLQLVFCAQRDSNRKLYVINADGTGLTNLYARPTSSGPRAVLVTGWHEDRLHHRTRWEPSSGDDGPTPVRTGRSWSAEVGTPAQTGHLTAPRSHSSTPDPRVRQVKSSSSTAMGRGGAGSRTPPVDGTGRRRSHPTGRG